MNPDERHATGVSVGWAPTSTSKVYPFGNLRGTRHSFASSFGSIIIIQHKGSPHDTRSTTERKVWISKQTSSQFLPIYLPTCNIKLAMTCWKISQLAKSWVGQTTQRVCLL